MQVPSMLLNFSKFDPLDRVWLKHTVDQVPDFFTDIIGQEIATLLDLLKENGHLIIIERQLSDDHGIQNNANRPYIDIRSPVAEPCNYLWSSVVGRATGCCKGRSILHVVS